MDTGNQNGKDKAVPSVLITGGNGLVGKHITAALLSKGYRVSFLSRSPHDHGNVKVSVWDPSKGILDPEVFEGIDCLVHLAGANIGEKRWTSSRKREIISSRVDSARLLFSTITGNGIKLKAFITASAVGYYGALTSSGIFTEGDPPAGDFLGTTCRLWEEAASQFGAAGIRTVQIRTAVVLDKNEGGLGKLNRFARFGLAARLGSGKQYFPWIHPADLAGIYIKAIADDTMRGPYNAAAPEYITHGELIKKLASIWNIRVPMPPVPSFILRLILGEMSVAVTEGSRVSALKILQAGYNFRFPQIDAALQDIMGS